MGVSIKLLKKYIDSGKTYQQGDTITVTEERAEWLLGKGVAERCSDAIAEPAISEAPQERPAPGFQRFKKVSKHVTDQDADVATGIIETDTTSEKEIENGTEQPSNI